MLLSTKSAQITVIGIMAVSLFLGLSQSSNSKPKQLGISLRPGQYYANGTYISIIGSKGKLCYRGGSRNGVTIASLNPSSENPNEYRVFGWENTSVMQKSRNILIFAGSQEFKYDGGGDNNGFLPRTPSEKACLKSKGNYKKFSSVPYSQSDL
jgi:hypothetical protein